MSDSVLHPFFLWENMSENEDLSANGDDVGAADSTLTEDDPAAATGIAAVKKYRVKGDGFDEDVDEATLIKGYQLERTANKRLEDVSTLDKSIQPYLPIIKALKAGDLRVLKQLGIPKDAIRKFSETELLEYIEEQDMSPDQKRALSAERERDNLKAERDQSEKKNKASYLEHLESQAAENIQSELQEAFDELKIPLKGNAILVSRTCEDMLVHSNAGKKTNMKSALKRALKSIDDGFSEFAKREYARDPETFLGSLPAELVDGIRKNELKKAKSQLPIGKKTADFENKKSRTPDSAFDDYMKAEFKKRG